MKANQQQPRIASHSEYDYEFAPPLEGTNGIGGTIGGVVSMLAAGACAFHGYKRTGSALWAAGWAVAGGALPLFVPVIAVAQGFGKAKKK